ncbi:pentatricopeptide repeat-containing protein At4g22760-like [Phalaenopsis equestris]|uniref:pentatricopeptide repeat-containing protein At4g22760-like n=1 Tax=Phalaenopsis equestris TaxID=78828 RepID=UPI0009E64DB0|nr:pentatricopeptide repeat-containing protein At4g22760-like [Phalaenopsis equestris]
MLLAAARRRRISSNVCNRSNYHSLEDPDPSSSWTRSIRSSADLRRHRNALSLYAQMLRFGHLPDPFTISAVLKACAHAPSMPAAVAIHAQIHKLGHLANVYTQTSLVYLYSKLDGVTTAQKVFDQMPVRNVVTWNSILHAHLKALDIKNARRVFDEIPVKDVVSWNSMVSGYAKAGEMDLAAELFWAMPERNPASWNGMISAYIDRRDMEQARKLFDEMPVRSNVSWIAMISGYSRCGDVASSENLFKTMNTKDIFSWNAMISCYAQNGFSKDAIQLFNRMRKPDTNVTPDEMTFSSVISACSQLGELRFGMWIETHISSIGIEMDDHLRTAFIDLYSKCGGMDQALKHYHHLRKKDLVSYSAMILGFGINGRCDEAISLFNEMVKSRIVPNSATFIGLLTAYNHAGLVDEGQICFDSMWRKYFVLPSTDHYAIMVDLLGRKGRLEEAYRLIQGMPMEPHSGVWGALLLACKLHGNVELGEIAARNCFVLAPDSSGYYVILANIYAEAGEWEKAKRLRKVMVEKGLAKVPGCSWVEPKRSCGIL